MTLFYNFKKYILGSEYFFNCWWRNFYFVWHSLLT